MMLYKIGSVGIECHCWPGARYTACFFSHEWLCCTGLHDQSSVCPFRPQFGHICPSETMCMALKEASPVRDMVKGTPGVILMPRETEQSGRVKGRGCVRFIGETWHNRAGIKGPSEKGERASADGGTDGREGVWEGTVHQHQLSHARASHPSQCFSNSALSLIMHFVNGGSIRFL